ncbi:helix-turn-helix transcriptional regulator [Ottowia sp.]|uniref:helix-turn-helix transcriptional regulator n=1 Tax=Ottowia sp. TaxID=1898956 RepID=UPI002CF5D397|nr:helix-turn-helix transcriptional regulator [Ottowia sp.]HOB66334.1 helix-turn-helix transcriptional regulator [Ottowia sp.]HPZ58330.1 helix-turn-helix transcriptional regulator [Ottowia sp.]HQD47396.1 helix-turn-helix transcriptional regulator [Ottowia sp.]
MSRSPARVTLRQLCRLGLPAPLLLPALLPVLRELVPASHAAFFFCDEHGHIANLYAERMLPPRSMAAYHERHDQKRFRERFIQRVAAECPTSRHSVTAAERLEPYYQDVLAPLDIAHMLYAVLRYRGQVIGQLSLYRGGRDDPFGAADEQTLSDVLHYLGEALAVQAQQLTADPRKHVVEEALAVLDDDGEELYADAGWQRIVRLAQASVIAPVGAQKEIQSVPKFVRAILAALTSAPQSAHHVHSAWGEFAFRRHDMASHSGAPAVALIVSRLAAEPVQLATGAAAKGLSPRQREVAVLMAQGHSNQDIAQLMGITTNTAASYVKQIFSRLGVHERNGVAQALMQASST